VPTVTDLEERSATDWCKTSDVSSTILLGAGFPRRRNEMAPLTASAISLSTCRDTPIVAIHPGWVIDAALQHNVSPT
jgi:hypothetical protein